MEFHLFDELAGFPKALSLVAIRIVFGPFTIFVTTFELTLIFLAAGPLHDAESFELVVVEITHVFSAIAHPEGAVALHPVFDPLSSILRTIAPGVSPRPMLHIVEVEALVPRTTFHVSTDGLISLLIQFRPFFPWTGTLYIFNELSPLTVLLVVGPTPLVSYLSRFSTESSFSVDLTHRKLTFVKETAGKEESALSVLHVVMELALVVGLVFECLEARTMFDNFVLNYFTGPRICATILRTVILSYRFQNHTIFIIVAEE